jgi:enediyne biosynthesis protein E4
MNITRRALLAGFASMASTSFLEGTPNSSPIRIRFDDISQSAGLTSPTVYGGSAINNYILETTGCGAAFIDYDNDGWLDIFLVNGTTLDANEGRHETNRLYRNNRNGTFTDVTLHAGLERSGWGQGVCVGDFDNDGYDDIFVTYWGQNVLYRNNGDGTFTDVTHRAGLSSDRTQWGSGCAFFDYDNDGYLDLFVTNYIDFEFEKAPLPGTCAFRGIPVNCGPQGLARAHSRLYRNNRNGTFTDVTVESGIGKAPPSYGLGVLVADFDNDGRPDIYVANDSEPSYLFWNKGDGTFIESGFEAGVATSGSGRNQSGMGVAAGDYDCDGLLDIFKTNFSDDLPNLYHNSGGRQFEEKIQSAGLTAYTRLLGWGCGFADFDNDGWLDILYVNGHVYPELARVDGPIRYKQPKVLYQNLGNGKFRDVSQSAGPGISMESAARGCAFGDVDNDGNIDVLVNPINGSPQLLRCTSHAGNNWITLKLIGTQSNRSAIGSRVCCITGSHQQIDEVRSGGSYFSQNDLRVHFGIGTAIIIDVIEIRWPSGISETLHNVPVNQIKRIVEGQTHA